MELNKNNESQQTEQELTKNYECQQPIASRQYSMMEFEKFNAQTENT